MIFDRLHNYFFFFDDWRESKYQFQVGGFKFELQCGGKFRGVCVLMGNGLIFFFFEKSKQESQPQPHPSLEKTTSEIELDEKKAKLEEDIKRRLGIDKDQDLDALPMPDTGTLRNFGKKNDQFL